MTHDDFLDIAIGYAKQSADNGGFPFGAVVVKDGGIVGDSRKDISDFALNLNHAEINAVANACENLKNHDLEGCVLYSNCRPCGLCMGAIKWAGIKEIYYAMDKADAKTIGWFDDIFADEAAPVLEHKSPDAELLSYMKGWYDRKRRTG